MAVKKKSPKKKPSRRTAKIPASLPIPAPPKAAGMGAAPWIILALVIAILFFIFHKVEAPREEAAVPPAHKMDAGIQGVATATAQPLPVAVATPQKRSTSPTGPLVWDRKKIKASTRFYVLREKDAVAEVHIFRSGNVPVRVLASDPGPKRTVVLVWDGKDSKGTKVPAGTYYARISSGSQGEMVQEIQVK